MAAQGLSQLARGGVDVREATIDDVRTGIISGRTSVREVTEGFLARIKTMNHRVNAIISLNPRALDDADRLDAAFQAGQPPGRLFGVPIFLKDNFDTGNMPTTAGCVALRKSCPNKDAPTVAALKDAGAIILGKANLHELALEGLTVSSLGGQTLNPYDSSRTPGGSSGGSAATVASSFCVFATGSDTVNSLRSPPSANSLFSIRPTWGLLSRTGIVPISYTQDVIGPIARTVKDVASALTVMASVDYDVDDNATAMAPPEVSGLDYAQNIDQGTLRGKRFGLIEGFFNRNESNETSPVNEAMQQAVRQLELAGATVISITDTTFNAAMISKSMDTQRFEYRQRLSDYLRRQPEPGNSPKSMPELYQSPSYLVIPSQYEYINTALVSSTDNATYNAVQRNIHGLRLHTLKTFKDHTLDALIYPEQANLVVKVGAASQSGRNGILAAVTGLPVAVVPVGFSPANEVAPIGVPVGMEILGRPWEEQKLLQIAYQFERLTPIRRAPLFAEEIVPWREMSRVPQLTPDVSNISPAYPLGTS